MKYGTQGPSQFTADTLQALKATLQREQAKANAKRQQSKVLLSGPLNRNFGFSGRSGARIDPGAIKVPQHPVRRQDGFAFGLHDDKLPVAGPSSSVRFVGPNMDGESRTRRAYRYMFEKVSERSEALDDKIDEFGELVKQHYNLEELGDPAASTEEEVVVVGRVTFDSESISSSVKLNEASLALESSRMMGAGARIPVRFDPGVKIRKGKAGIGGIGLFPGAMVALKGKNGGGGYFLATEILSLPPLRAAPRSMTKSEDGQSSFTMHIACGPFTSDADLEYAPWYSMLSRIKNEKPLVVLLVGPFVDSAHPLVKVGDVGATPAEMFRQHFLDPLEDYLNSAKGSIVLIVPSTRDIISDHAVYPQPEFSATLPGLDARIGLLPNPARFSLNDVSFGVSSVDVLFHLRKEEFLKRGQEVDSLPSDDIEGQTTNDPMVNSCRHLLLQRSFYPIFPAPLDLSHEVNLDVAHWDGLRLGAGAEVDTAPDVLITPSRLKHFSKVVDDTIAINPSFSMKGMFAALNYSGDAAAVPMRNRLKVELVKLD
ncbi:DNA polymerase alpha subunit B [Obba rivulosa]|uniref:DNA polymerase alpha subunit B n=1 Tax=Obba rivulosa TaxID=1052685 RepID=A0A8E2AVS4_9APHY|nr:DNA polymerase alpha subunit B [Obba rivulosa]